MDPIAAEAGPSSAHQGTSYNVSYQYQPFDRNIKSIRLLQIQPGKLDDPIHCMLQHFDLASQPIYVALSYMWDHDTEQVSIVCGGKDIQVGHNLHRFLRQFRKVCGDVRAWLWIDALCINQKDIRERNHQVAQMKHIYQGAALVIAWLGEATDDDVLAFRALRDDRQSLDQWPWEAWYQLFCKPYWSRVWIIQEFVLGQETHLWCGEMRANSADFKWVGERLHGVHNIQGTLGWRLLSLRETWQDRGWGRQRDRLTLRKLSTSFAMSNSTVPLDFIYGFMGIAEDSYIVPDYAESPARLLINVIQDQFVWAPRAIQNFDSSLGYNDVSGHSWLWQRGSKDATIMHAEEKDEVKEQHVKEQHVKEQHETDKVTLRSCISGGHALGFMNLPHKKLPYNEELGSFFVGRRAKNSDDEELAVFAHKRSAVGVHNQRFQDHDFISHLRQKLGVSREQLVKAVTKHAPDLLPKIHVMVAKDYIELGQCLDPLDGPNAIEKMLVAILGHETFQERGLGVIDYG
jgi:hypothetical protein